jgi:CBS domain-containing protein
MLSNKVKEIMTREVATTAASSTIFNVMELMAAKNVGAVIVTDDQMPVGIFTEQDVLKRVVNRKLDSKKTGIRRVMTTPIQVVSEETHIIKSLKKMYKEGFRHLLVRGEKRAMVGIVSMRDILKFAVELGHGLTETQTIGTIMPSNITAVDGSQSIYETIETMIKQNTDCVIVIREEEPKGIFTERDVLKRVAIKNIATRKTPIEEVMTADLVAASHSALIGEVLAEMYKGGFRNMPIQSERGKLVGIVSMGDVLKYAKALDVDEEVQKTWKEIEEFWDSEDYYTPG